jgi:hypothetical protein
VFGLALRRLQSYLPAFARVFYAEEPPPTEEEIRAVFTEQAFLCVVGWEGGPCVAHSSAYGCAVHLTPQQQQQQLRENVGGDPDCWKESLASEDGDSLAHETMHNRPRRLRDAEGGRVLKPLLVGEVSSISSGRQVFGKGDIWCACEAGELFDWFYNPWTYDPRRTHAYCLQLRPPFLWR